MKYPVLLMQSVQKIAQGFQSLLTDRKKNKLAGCMQKLGFSDIAGSFYELQPESGERVSRAKNTVKEGAVLGHKGNRRYIRIPSRE